MGMKGLSYGSAISLIGLAATLLLLGCGDGSEEVRVYKVAYPEGHAAKADGDHLEHAEIGPDSAPRRRIVPRPAAPADPASDGSPANAPATSPAPVNPSSGMVVLPGMEDAASSVRTPDWIVPESWDELPPTAIRKGNFRIQEEGGTVEITVTVFPGDVGGLEANVNRWKQQIGLAPTQPPLLEEAIESVEVDGQPAFFVDLLSPQNPSGAGILGAVIPRGERTWFVKMIGDQAILSNQESELRAFLDSMRF